MKPDQITDRHADEIESLASLGTANLVRQVGRVADEIREILSRPDSHHVAGKDAELGRLAAALDCIEHVVRERFRPLRSAEMDRSFDAARTMEQVREWMLLDSRTDQEIGAACIPPMSKAQVYQIRSGQGGSRIDTITRLLPVLGRRWADLDEA